MSVDEDAKHVVSGRFLLFNVIPGVWYAYVRRAPKIIFVLRNFGSFLATLCALWRSLGVILISCTHHLRGVFIFRRRA